MVCSSAAIDIQRQYQMGQRQFSTVHLRGADLRGLNLSNTDLQGVDLSGANLREVNLSFANLAGAFLNEADLTGANLESANLAGAFLIKAYLIKANLSFANLTAAYVTGAYLTKSYLFHADLRGAYLNGTQLTGADFTGVRCDRSTRFDRQIDLEKLGIPKKGASLAQESPRSPEELLQGLNYLSSLSVRYLGIQMTLRYWQSGRPSPDSLPDLVLDRSARFSWTGNPQSRLSGESIQKAKEWSDRFILSCSSILADFPCMVDPKQIAFPLTRAKSAPEV
jgi:uncharacterized protein YjbI with pentapeptide repeats